MKADDADASAADSIDNCAASEEACAAFSILQAMKQRLQ